MAPPILRRDYIHDPDLGVVRKVDSPYTQEQCEAAEDARLSVPRLRHDPEFGPVWSIGGGYQRPEAR